MNKSELIEALAAKKGGNVQKSRRDNQYHF